MKTIAKIITFLILGFPMITYALTRDVPFSMDDRDRMIRTEMKVETLDLKIDSKVDGLRSEMNTRFEAADKQMAGLRSEMAARFDQLFLSLIHI